MRKPKVRDQKYYDVLEKHVLELMKHGVTLNKWNAMHAKLAALETKVAQQEAQVSAYLAAGVSWTSEGKWVNTAALRLEQDLRRVKEEKATLERALNAREAGVERLRVAIEAADAEHKYACLNHGNSAQSAAWEKLQHLKDAMALVR